jgi:hypothetical protein
MPAVDGSRTGLRCHHCGREVVETVHTRSSYRVDYFGLHTGEVEPMTIPQHDDPSVVVTVMRLIRAWEVFTCAECYRRPEVRREREALFRPELTSATTAP